MADRWLASANGSLDAACARSPCLARRYAAPLASLGAPSPCPLVRYSHRSDPPRSLPALLLDRGDDLARDIDARIARDLARAGRARHVDLGEVVADHVESDEQQAHLLQRRP